MADTSSAQLPSGLAATPRSGNDDPSISFLLEAFLAERRGRTGVGTGRGAAAGTDEGTAAGTGAGPGTGTSTGTDTVGYHGTVNTIDLLRGSLNRYGYHGLSDADRDRFEHRFFDEDDPEAFSELFGEAELRAGVPEFLDVHLPKRAHVDPSVVTLARKVTNDLLAWLDTRATT